mmetsp:Transcript_87649/g.203904  ORF Transcript_87649/g.203904 Transcript_87649/m.203904 type:complete len:233 (+) Transcript_87649:800-1498(+)
MRPQLPNAGRQGPLHGLPNYRWLQYISRRKGQTQGRLHFACEGQKHWCSLGEVVHHHPLEASITVHRPLLCLRGLAVNADWLRWFGRRTVLLPTVGGFECVWCMPARNSQLREIFEAKVTGRVRKTLRPLACWVVLLLLLPSSHFGEGHVMSSCGTMAPRCHRKQEACEHLLHVRKQAHGVAQHRPSRRTAHPSVLEEPLNKVAAQYCEGLTGCRSQVGVPESRQENGALVT